MKKKINEIIKKYNFNQVNYLIRLCTIIKNTIIYYFINCHHKIPSESNSLMYFSIIISFPFIVQLIN